MGSPAGPDLFGYVDPRIPKLTGGRAPRRRRGGRRVRDQNRLETCDADLAWLSNEITEAIWSVRMEVIGLIDDGREVEIDFMLQNLDDELTDALDRIRWKKPR